MFSTVQRLSNRNHDVGYSNETAPTTTVNIISSDDEMNDGDTVRTVLSFKYYNLFNITNNNL